MYNNSDNMSTSRVCLGKSFLTDKLSLFVITIAHVYNLVHNYSL